MTKEGITPLPWEALPDENGNPTYIVGPGTRPVADCEMGYGIEGEANAAYIVEACNNYPAMKEALEAFRSADENDWAHLDLFIPQSGHGQFWRAVFAEFRTAMDGIREVGR